MQIYLARNNVQASPYTLDEMNRMLAGGQITLTDLAWHEGMAEWRSVGQLTHGQYHYQPGATAAPQTPPMPVNLGKSPMATDALESPQPVVQELHISSLYRRFSASIADMCLFFVSMTPILRHLSLDRLGSGTYQEVMKALEAVPQQDMLVASILMLALVTVQCLLTVRRGQTLGKLVLGTRVVDQQTGEIPGLTQILWLRTVLFNFLYNIPTLGLLVLVADTIAMIMSPHRQSLHDRLAKTVVVDVNRPQPNP